MKVINYLFTKSPGQNFDYYIPFIIVIVLLIAAYFIFNHIYREKRKTNFAFKRNFKNLGKRMIQMAIMFTILILLRYENIPYFAMRIWLYLGIGLFLYIAYRYLKTYHVDYPKEKENQKTVISKTPEKNRYIASKKRK
jgi:hypothetical protein